MYTVVLLRHGETWNQEPVTGWTDVDLTTKAV